MTSDSVKPPVWFWIVGVIALIWNGMGVKAYLDQAYMTPEKLAALPNPDQAMYSIEYPAWVTAAFAVAVFGGTIGSILLLFRKKSAYFVFVVSLVGILAQMTYAFFHKRLDRFIWVGGSTFVNHDHFNRSRAYVLCEKRNSHWLVEVAKKSIDVPDLLH